jgi:hypothetical protein
MVEVSPFPFQGPLAPEQVAGRDELLDTLIERVTARRVTALLGPRRFGKTSVLRRVASELDQVGVTVLTFDLYEVTSPADLAVRIDDGMAAGRGPGLASLRKLVTSAEINLGMLKLSFARRSADRPDPIAVIHVLLDALVDASQRDPTVAIFDEFPAIDRIEGAAGLLRTKLQAHVQQLGLVFAGSQTALMRAMFTDVTRPFYGQADLVEIGPLSPSAVADTIEAGFEATGRDPGRLAGHVNDFAGGHPQRTMQLADAAWRNSTPGGAYDDSVWADALADVRGQTDLAHESMYSRSASSDQKALRLIANGEPLFGAAAGLVDLSPGAGQSSRDRLVDLGEISRAGSQWRLVDPLYADFIRRRLPL